MQRRINDFQIPFPAKRYLADGIVIGVVNIFPDKLDETSFSGTIKINPFYLRNILGYLIDQILIIRRDKLTAILIIDFFAVIGRQVVAGTEHVSGNSVQIADGERQLRCASGRVVQIHVDLIGCVNLCGGDGQTLAV